MANNIVSSKYEKIYPNGNTHIAVTEPRYKDKYTNSCVSDALTWVLAPTTSTLIATTFYDERCAAYECVEIRGFALIKPGAIWR